MVAPRPLTLLIIEDTEDDAALMLAALERHGYAPVSKRVDSRRTLEDALYERRWDVILADNNLPGFSGREALRCVSARGSDAPFILVSGTVGEELAVSFVKAGAADYVLKANLGRLGLAIDRALDEADARRTHREVERRLRESEERYRSVIENIEEIVFAGTCSTVPADKGSGASGGLELVLSFVSPRIHHYLGYSAAELLLRRDVALGLLHPEDFASVSTTLAHAFTQRRGTTFVCRLIAANGQERWIDVNFVPGLDADGRPARFFGTAHDLTERKLAETALLRSEARYRALVEALPDLIFVLTADGVCVDYHASAGNGLLVAPEDFLGRPLRDLLPLGVLRQIEPVFAEVAAHGGSSLVESSINLADGVGHFEVHFTRMEDGRVMAVVRDVTRTKQAEGRLRDILEHSTNLFYALAPDLSILYISPQSRGFFDCEPFEIRGFWDLVTDNPENEVGRDRSLEALATGTRQPPFELELLTRTSRRLWVEVNEAPVVEDGRTVAMVGSLTDISARKRAEAERTRAEQAYLHAQRMESIGRLAGGVAHDFNNLLSVILSYSTFAMESLSSDLPLHQDLNEIRLAGERATELTRQLLAFSRRQVLSPSVLDLNAVVTDMQKMLRRLVGEDVELVSELAAGLYTVHADKGRVEQILMNLVVNARDAMPDGGKLEIATANLEIRNDSNGDRPLMPPGAYVLMTVRDSGTGMTEEVLEHAFEPFFTTKEQGKGTGLGLATVYGIVQQSRGYIWVTSALGHGTRISIGLPRCERLPSLLPVARQRAEHNGDETVIVVEDERAVRLIAERILKKAGYRVLTFGNGSDALSACQRLEQRVDLLITDVVMPVINGPEVASRFGALRPRAKVLFMSGYADEMIAHHGVLARGTHFIAKPFNPDALVIKVREVLDA